MPVKTHRKNLDRFILFEVGIIFALLFVNYALNISYGEPTTSFYNDENVLDETPFQLVMEEDKPIPKQKEESKPKKQDNIQAAHIFNPQSLVLQIDDLFKLQTKPSKSSLPQIKNIAPIVVTPRLDTTTIVRDWADIMPEFPGGDEALNAYIIDQFTIPDIIYEVANTVEVVVEFIVNEQGEIENIRILQCSKPGLGIEEETQHIYKNMPKWFPGKSNGRPTKVRMKQPIKINIQ